MIHEGHVPAVQSAPSTVADLMRREVITISPSSSVRELTDLFRLHRVSGVPVVDASRNVVGTVSVSDLMWLSDWLLEGSESGDGAWAAEHLEEKKVRDVMTPDVFGVEPDASLAELAGFFSRTGLGRAVVLERGKLVGIVSVIDLLGSIADRARPQES
jgi:CBS-domain-containing membrane protein